MSPWLASPFHAPACLLENPLDPEREGGVVVVWCGVELAAWRRREWRGGLDILLILIGAVFPHCDLSASSTPANSVV
jgi:hypothetical protein